LTPEKYAAAVKGLQAEPAGGDLTSFTVNGNVGEIQTSQVDLAFTYNGANTLAVTVKAKHGLAKWASESTIQSHLVDMLQKVGA
jgi:hypothetical protein